MLGKKILINEEISMSSFCRTCGTALRPAASFCPQCGASLFLPIAPVKTGVTRAVVLSAAVIIVAIFAYLAVSYTTKTGFFSSKELYQIELLSTNERYSVFFARYDSGITKSGMLDSARRRCQERFAEIANSEGCIVAASRWDSQIDKSYSNDLQEAFKRLQKYWSGDSDLVTAIYAFEPDNSTIRRRPDELFVVNCSVFSEWADDSDVVCKNSGDDELSRDLSRELRQADAAEEAKKEAAVEVADAIAGASAAAMDAAGYSTFHVVADANRRSGPTASSSFAGKISRGTVLQGMMIIGEDGTSNWLRLADNSGYVSAVNISQTPPPQLATILNGRRFRPSTNLRLYASPSEQSPVIDTVPAGTVLVLTGITDNGFTEAKGRSGGVGYFVASGYDFSN